MKIPDFNSLVTHEARKILSETTLSVEINESVALHYISRHESNLHGFHDSGTKISLEERLFSLAFEAINYRFFNISDLERPVLNSADGTIRSKGSLAIKSSLEDVFNSAGKNFYRFQKELLKWDDYEKLFCSLDDSENRLNRLLSMNEKILFSLGELSKSLIEHDYCYIKEWMFETGLFEDRLYKQVQHFIVEDLVQFGLVDSTTASSFTLLADYRVPELLLDIGAIQIENFSSHSNGKFRFSCGDEMVQVVRAASIVVGNYIKDSSSLNVIEIDRFFWNASRNRDVRNRIFVNTEMF